MINESTKKWTTKYGQQCLAITDNETGTRDTQMAHET